MQLSDRVLGSPTAKSLRARTTAPLLVIGSDVFTRHDLGAIDCYAFIAAANLSTILNRELKVKNTRDLFDHVPPTSLALPRLGAISLAVLGAAFEAKGLGGDAPLETWVTKHQEKDGPNLLVTFHTLKHRDELERAGDRKALKARKAARRDQAHRHRVDRFTSRQKKAS